MSGYSKDFTEAQKERARASEEARKERERLNAEARARYLAGLEADRQAKRDEDAAQLEEELAPAKERARRQWLVDHPDMTEQDFESHAWPLLRENLVGDPKERIKNTYLEQARASGRTGI